MLVCREGLKQRVVSDLRGEVDERVAHGRVRIGRKP